MQVKVQVIIETDTGQRLVEEVASLVRNTLSAETLGLSLAEAKEILQHLQASVVNQHGEHSRRRASLCHPSDNSYPSGE